MKFIQVKSLASGHCVLRHVEIWNAGLDFMVFPKSEYFAISIEVVI